MRKPAGHWFFDYVLPLAPPLILLGLIVVVALNAWGGDPNTTIESKELRFGGQPPHHVHEYRDELGCRWVYSPRGSATQALRPDGLPDCLKAEGR